MLTRIEIAQHFAVAPVTIRDWTVNHKMPAKKFGGRYMYNLSQSITWLKNNKPWVYEARKPFIEELRGNKNGQN